MRFILLAVLIAWTGVLLAETGKHVAKKSGPLVTLNSEWGPDAYGYIARDSNEPDGPPVDWIDISGIGDVVTGLGDDNIVDGYSVGFPFRFYWYDVSTFAIGSNGYLRFSGTGQLSHPFSPIPNTTPPNDLICMLAADFNPGAGGTVYHWTNNVDTVIVSFDGVPPWNGSNPHFMQVVLSMVDTSITFNYGDMPGGFSDGTGYSGIENNAGDVGLQLYTNNSIPSNYSIKFYYPQETDFEVFDVGVLSVQDEISGGFHLSTTQSVTPSAVVKNLGNQDVGSFDVTAEVLTYPGNAVLHSEVITVDGLLTDEEVEINFTTAYTPGDVGAYFVRVSADLAGDLVGSNDQKDVEFHVVSTPGVLSFDDGSSEQLWAWNGGNGGMGVYYQPPVYPATITTLSAYLSNTGGPTLLEIYDDDGDGGSPGTRLYSEEVSTFSEGWVDVSPNIDVEDGGVYAAWVMIDASSSSLGIDQSSLASRRSWEFTGVWATFRNFETDDAMLNLSFQVAGSTPVISVGPASFEFEVVEGSNTTDILTISNVGTADLSWSLIDMENRIVLELSDETEIPLQVEASPLFSTQFAEPTSTGTAPPPHLEGDIELILDDGIRENSIGLTGGGQFIWLNRFTPDPIQFPITIDEVQVLFGAGVGVNEGEIVDLYYYEDPDGNPDNGATHLASQTNLTVQAVDDATWSVYTPDTPVAFNTVGDILIALVNRTAGIDDGEFAAAIDQTASQGRSYVGIYNAGDPADPPPIPAETWGTIDSFGLAGNWMVRAFGQDSGVSDCAWLSADPQSGTIAPGASTDVTLTVDAAGLASGTYECSLFITSNDSGAPEITVPVTLEVVGNEAPTALDDEVTTDENIAIDIEVLANDSDPNGDVLTVTSTTDPANGSVAINNGETVTYTPNDFFDGTDSFEYTISDGNGGEATATVTVHVTDVVGIGDAVDGLIPDEFELHQNFPNPFNPTTRIRYGLPQAAQVKIEIYNLLGQRVAIALDAHRPAGYHELHLDASHLTSGIYFYHIQAADFSASRKMMLMK